MSRRNIINCYNKNNNNKRKREFYGDETSTYYLRFPYHLMAIILLWPTNYASTSSFKLVSIDSKMVKTPIENNTQLNVYNNDPLRNQHFTSRTGWECSLYLIITWPSISYTIHIVNQFIAAAQSSYYDVVLSILRDLKAIFFHRINLFFQSLLALRAYTNAR